MTIGAKGWGLAALAAVAASIAAPAFPARAPQAPLSALPPVDYSLGADSQPQPGVPKGTLTKHVLAPGKFFPGSIAFGGPDRTWLYVTQGGKLFRRETRRTGAVAWELVKPPVPGL